MHTWLRTKANAQMRTGHAHTHPEHIGKEMETQRAQHVHTLAHTSASARNMHAHKSHQARLHTHAHTRAYPHTPVRRHTEQRHDATEHER